MSDWTLPFGANVDGEGARFRVWAATRERVEAVIISGGGVENAHPLEREPAGWWGGHVRGVRAGARYRYRVDGGDAYPDPASRHQPEGVHGPSEVVDPSTFRWTDAGWRGRALEELVIYELHVGTFTPAGTFDGAIERLDHLVDLGVTAIEPMPVAQASGTRNWGYDGVHLFAPSAAYGGPEGFRRLVDAAHARGLAVILDVVYNHLGPEGNYLPAITAGRFFTARHRTPWGDGIDFDGPESGPMRDFIVNNALHWAHEYHVDGLRLDATHAIQDDSRVHIVAEVAERVRASLPAGRRFVVIAEDERNERRVVTPREDGGWGLDAVWADDFHHQLRVMTAGDRHAYFAPYSGSAEDVAATLRRGWFFQGERGAEGGVRGTPSAGIAAPAFVHCIQNHDQVGNRADGARLNHQIALGAYRAACALLLLTPYTPLLWMGQEWAACAPFLYFTDHSGELGRQVTEGRQSEFHDHDPSSANGVPDPQALDTFLASKLDWAEREELPHSGIVALHRELLRLRSTDPALRERDRRGFAVAAVGRKALALRREGAGSALLLVASFEGPLAVTLAERECTRAPGSGEWSLALSTEEGRFGGLEGEVASLRGGVLETAGAGAVLLRATG